DPDERILPGPAPRHAHQCDVLRLSAGCGAGRLPGGLDDPAVGLAQRAGAGRRGAAGAGDPHAGAPAGIRALPDRQQAAGRA
nr:hypothetical protein [Tanacetum cinerariifolium]